MTRDELLLVALRGGEASTVELSGLTGLAERTCRYGVARLIAEGYAWSPRRGLWRLTGRGRAIAVELPALPAVGGVDETLVETDAASGARSLDLTL